MHSLLLQLVALAMTQRYMHTKLVWLDR